MTMTFNPSNAIIQLCMEGMRLEDSGKTDEALATFLKAWDQASNHYEKFLVAYHLGIRQKEVSDQLHWMEQALSFSLKINDPGVQSAYSTLYAHLADYYEAIHDLDHAKKYSDLSMASSDTPIDDGPFYHGTRADLTVGDFLTPGGLSNYKTDLKMNHIYFTANSQNAGLAATLAKGSNMERVYIVQPTGDFEHDPNLTDKKFPGNLTRSYRSQQPLKILGEITDWAKLTPEERQEWDKKLAKNNGEIIN